MNDLYNSEHYPDRTAAVAIKNLSNESKRVHGLIHKLKDLAWEDGFTIESRVILKAYTTGRVYR